jgi:hypothetical protein
LVDLEDLNVVIPSGNGVSLTKNILTDVNFSIRHNWIELTILDSQTWKERSFEFKGISIGLESINMLLEGSIGGSLISGCALQELLASKEEDLSLVDLTGDESGRKVERIG